MTTAKPAIHVRRGTSEDKAQVARLGTEAFGYPSDAATQPEPTSDTQIMYVAEVEGRVVGKMRDRFYESWWGGTALATAGVASVAIEPEARGQGVMAALMRELMSGARARGAVVSTLAPTAPAIYRRFGYATVVDTEVVRVPTVALREVRADGGSLRRATADDDATIRELYEHWARRQNGPLTRGGPLFATKESDQTIPWNTTLAFDDDGVAVGYCGWRHTGEYKQGGKLEVSDLIATTRLGYQLLLGSLGSSYAVAPITEFFSSGASGLDLIRLVAPELPWRSDHRDQYMLAVLDVERAVSSRTYSPSQRMHLRFAIEGAILDEVNGTFEIDVADGRARCERVAPDGNDVPIFTAEGFALLYSGAQSCANIAMVGGVRGVQAAQDDLTSLFGGWQVHIRDYF